MVGWKARHMASWFMAASTMMIAQLCMRDTHVEEQSITCDVYCELLKDKLTSTAKWPPGDRATRHI